MKRYTKEFKLTLTTANGIVADEVIDLDELGYEYEEWERLTDEEKDDILGDYLEAWIPDVAKAKYEELPEPKQQPPLAKYEPIRQDYDVYGIAAI